jgi:hypothetical protein
VGFTVFFCISAGSVNEEMGFSVKAQRGRAEFQGVWLKKVTKKQSFHHMWNYFFNIVVARQTINAG